MARKKRKTTVVITGATGFIGSHLCSLLVRRGWAVHAIIRSRRHVKRVAPLLKNVSLHVHDGSMSNMISIVRAIEPHLSIHLASLFIARHKPEDVEPLISSNVLFGAQFVEASVRCGIKKFINTGTSWQHYRDDAYSPVCLYAATKQAFENILQYYVEAEALKVITLKLFDTYGPNDFRGKLISKLLEAANSGRVLPMSPGHQVMDLVHVDDVVSAFWIAANSFNVLNRKPHSVYAVSSGKGIALRKLVNVCEKVTGKVVPVQWGALAYRSREVMMPWCNGKRVPGWKPRVELAVGLKRLAKEMDI